MITVHVARYFDKLYWKSSGVAGAMVGPLRSRGKRYRQKRYSADTVQRYRQCGDLGKLCEIQIVRDPDPR